MENIFLSDRLKAVLDFIPAQARLADIGSDHAHLACRAVQDHIAICAVAGEARPGPFHRSADCVSKLGLNTYVSVRLGDGLDVISQGEVNCIVMAGMGGELIRDILERGKTKLDRKMTLILQPNIRESVCRAWLSQNGWQINDETIIEEQSHFYEVIRANADVSSPSFLTSAELMMGPVLIRKQSDVFRKKWLRRERKLMTILQLLERSEQTDAVLGKKTEYRKTLQIIRQHLK